MSEIDDRLTALRRRLEAAGLQDWSERLDEAVRSGSTGGEIMGRLRWEVAQLLQTESSLDAPLRAEAEEVNELLRSTRR